MKKRYWMVGLGSFVVTLALFLTLLFPLWDKRFDVFDLAGKDREPLSPLEVYGVMPAAVTDTYNWLGTTVGINAGIDGACRINNTNYYVTVATGSSSDGWAHVLYVWGNNGTIKKSIISSFEYDADNGQYASIKHIPGTDKYVVLYRDTSTVSVCTLKIWENGTIRKAVIDQQALTYRDYANTNGVSYLLQVTDNVWAVAYAGITTAEGILETVWINSSGTINNTLLDLESYAAYGNFPRMCLIDSNTIALTYYMTTDNILMTYNISSAGLITDTPADSWAYEAAQYYHSYINKVGSTVYDITYMDTAFDTYTKTVTIADTGMITKAWIDTLTVKMDASPAGYVETFVVQDSQTSMDGRGILGTTIKDSSSDGWIYTWNVTSTGTLDAAIIDSLEFNATDDLNFAHVEWVNQSYYLIIYTDATSRGWSNTVVISTNWAEPVVSNEVPENSTVGVSLSPKCNITISDGNGDAMTLSWYTNESDGVTWVRHQTNSSVGNGTYRWSFTEASSYDTKYWWRVYCNDSMHNVTEWYCFTTEAPSGQWFVINNSINGSVWNKTGVYQVINSSVNGSIWNGTGAFKVINSSINGSIWNKTGAWSIINSSVNGSIWNKTGVYQVINSSVNGSIWNGTGAFKVINSSINGSIWNKTGVYQVINSSVNGSIWNKTGTWSIISSSINGSIWNRSEWKVINSSINGSVCNLSISASPFNINLYVHNPNPGNGTHNTNYLKRDSAGLTTSVDVVYQNFTTPGVLIPGDYSLTVVGTSPSNGPNIQNVSPVYADAYNNLTGQPISGQLYTGQFIVAGDYCIIRSFLSFDTSSLPDEAVIDSMHVQLVVFDDYSDTDFKVSLQTVKPPMPHNPLIPIDYERHAFSALATTGQRNTSGAVPGGYFNISVNASGINDVNFTGYTYWVVRSNQDIIASVPVGDEWIGFYAPGGVHPEYGPRLIVNYSIPGSNWQHIVNLSWVSNSSGPWVEYNVSYVTGNETVTVFNSNFSDVDTYWWYVSWESNGTNVGFSNTFEFETVGTGGGGGGFRRDRFVMGLVIGAMSFLMLGAIVFRRKRKL